jgi:hypothetical protein
MHESVYDNIEDEIIYIHSLGPKFFWPQSGYWLFANNHAINTSIFLSFKRSNVSFERLVAIMQKFSDKKVKDSKEC